MTRKGDYAVGYGRPPDSGKIKKGEVRNAAGRRGKNKKKDPENFWEIVLEELDRRMPVSVNGKRKKASPNQLGAVQFARRIAEGDPKATRDLLTYLRHMGGRAQAAPGVGVLETPPHKLTMESIVRRIRSMDPISAGGGVPLLDGAGI